MGWDHRCLRVHDLSTPILARSVQAECHGLSDLAPPVVCYSWHSYVSRFSWMRKYGAGGERETWLARRRCCRRGHCVFRIGRVGSLLPLLWGSRKVCRRPFSAIRNGQSYPDRAECGTKSVAPLSSGPKHRYPHHAVDRTLLRPMSVYDATSCGPSLEWRLTLKEENLSKFLDRVICSRPSTCTQ